MIKIEHLSKAFNGKEIFKDINLDIKTGEIVGIIGPSGAGKSTFLRCLNLLEKPNSGRITIDGERFEVGQRLPKQQLLKFRQYSTMVFQQFNLFQQKTVLDNVLEGLLVVQKLDLPAARKIALEKLDEVGLADYINFYPHQLSGGQKQRVAFARGLALDRPIVLLDEPTSALDSELVGEVLQTLKQVVLNNPDQTVIIISHELAFIKQVASRVLFFDQGQILETGTPKQIFEHPQEIRTQQFLSRFNREVLI